MNRIGVVLISGACCNPALKPMDERISTRVREVAAEFGVEVALKTVSIASAAIGGGVGLGRTADNEVRQLISRKGIGVLPIVFINGTMAFYGGVPVLEDVRDKVRAAVQ